MAATRSRRSRSKQLALRGDTCTKQLEKHAGAVPYLVQPPPVRSRKERSGQRASELMEVVKRVRARAESTMNAYGRHELRDIRSRLTDTLTTGFQLMTPDEEAMEKVRKRAIEIICAKEKDKEEERKRKRKRQRQEEEEEQEQEEEDGGGGGGEGGEGATDNNDGATETHKYTGEICTQLREEFADAALNSGLATAREQRRLTHVAELMHKVLKNPGKWKPLLVRDNYRSRKQKDELPTKNTKLSANETLLRIIVCYTRGEAAKEMQEFLVLGSQRLTVLKDQIECPSDRVNACTTGTIGAEGSTVQSGYFLFGDTFYSDMRHEDNVDYAENIIAFARNQRRAGGGCAPVAANAAWTDKIYSRARMEDVRFDELELKCGRDEGYIYSHQGCCEHTVVVADIRCIHETDPQDRSMYPLATLKRRGYSRSCAICEEPARFVIRARQNHLFVIVRTQCTHTHSHTPVCTRTLDVCVKELLSLASMRAVLRFCGS